MGRATLAGLLGWVLACGCTTPGTTVTGGTAWSGDAAVLADAGSTDASQRGDAQVHQALVEQCALLDPARCPAPYAYPGSPCDLGLLAFVRLDDPPADWTLGADGFHASDGPMYCTSFRHKDVCGRLPYAPDLCRSVSTGPCPPDLCPPDPWVYPPGTRAAVVVSETERCAATETGLYCGPSGQPKLVVAGSFRVLQQQRGGAVIALGDAGLAYHVAANKELTRLYVGTDDIVNVTGNGYLWAAITRKGKLVIGEGADGAACGMSEHAAFVFTLGNYMYFATTEGTVASIQPAHCTHLPEPIQGVSAQYCGITAAPIVYGATHAWFSRAGCAYD